MRHVAAHGRTHTPLRANFRTLFNVTVLCCIAPHCTALHNRLLYYTTLYYIKLHCTSIVARNSIYAHQVFGTEFIVSPVSPGLEEQATKLCLSRAKIQDDDMNYDQPIFPDQMFKELRSTASRLGSWLFML